MEGQGRAALRHLRRAIALLEATEDTLHLARAHLLSSEILILDGQADDAAPHLEAAERLFDLGGDARDLGAVRAQQAKRAALLGDHEEATRRATDFGSVFDAVADRVSEAAVLFGLLVYFGDIGRTEDQQLTFVAVVASLLVSYIRARAEIVGVELREGLLSRAPRVLLISAGLILEPYWDVWESSVHIMLWVLVLMSTLTAAQRLVLVWLKTRWETRDEA